MNEPLSTNPQFLNENHRRFQIQNFPQQPQPIIESNFITHRHISNQTHDLHNQNRQFGPFVYANQQSSLPINNRPSSFIPQNQYNHQNINTIPNTNQSQNQNNIPVTSHIQNRPRNLSRSQRNRFSYSLNKMDGIFAQSFTSLKRQLLIHALIVFILLFAVIILYKFDLFTKNYGQTHGVILIDGQLKQSVIPFLILAQFLIILFKLTIFFSTYNKLSFALQVCKQISHSVTQQLADLNKSFDENISPNFFDYSLLVVNQQEVQQGQKKKHKEITMNQIKIFIKKQACCSCSLHQLFEFGMLVCAIYLIVVLAQDQTTWLQKLLLITTLVYWMIQNIKLIFYATICLLFPFIALGLFIYSYFSSNSNEENKPTRAISVPEAINPTNQQIINCGGTCSICMMQFDTDNEVVILPCSDKHMFHELCIKGWINFKSTCPNCRFDLAA